MGRPINKKYFGNTNEGAATPSTDNGIGGEGVGSVTITNAGNYNAELPTVSFPTPSIPGGVQATGSVVGKAVQVYSFDANGNGYSMGDTLTFVGGSNTTTATATVTGVITVGRPFMTDDGADYDTGDLIDFGGTGWSSNLKISVDTAVAGNITAYSVDQAGYWVGPGAAPTTLTATSANTVGAFDNNGTGAVFNIYYGVRSANVAAVGDYTTVPANPVSVTVGHSVTTSATANVRWGVKAVTLTGSGSGYISTADAAPTFSSPVTAGTGTSTAIGSAVLQDTQENAIVAIDLSTGGVVDIVKQESSDSYWVETSTLDTVLLGLAAPTDPIGLYIRAEDSDGKYYWVKSLKAHLAVIGEVTGGGEFPEDAEVRWSFDAAEENISVQIRNAI